MFCLSRKPFSIRELNPAWASPKFFLYLFFKKKAMWGNEFKIQSTGDVAFYADARSSRVLMRNAQNYFALDQKRKLHSMAKKMLQTNIEWVKIKKKENYFAHFCEVVNKPRITSKHAKKRAMIKGKN